MVQGDSPQGRYLWTNVVRPGGRQSLGAVIAIRLDFAFSDSDDGCKGLQPSRLLWTNVVNRQGDRRPHRQGHERQLIISAIDHEHPWRLLPSRAPRRLTDRQGERKDGTLGRIGPGPEPPPVGLDDRSADGQPHAQALWLGRIKRLKEALKSLRVQPWTRIAHHH